MKKTGITNHRANKRTKSKSVLQTEVVEYEQKNLFRQNKTVFIPYFIFLSCGLALLLLFSKPEIHLFINIHNNLFFDVFFKYFTFFGDGFFAFFVVIALLFYKYRHSLNVAVAVAITTMIVQTIKAVLIDVSRPTRYFSGIAELHLIEGVKMHSLNSFPSGHTATGFCIFISLAFIIKNRYAKLLLFIAAVLVGYSRMYLSQHFLIDVVFGSLTGIIITSLVFWKSAIFQYVWLERSILTSIKNKD